MHLEWRSRFRAGGGICHFLTGLFSPVLSSVFDIMDTELPRHAAAHPEPQTPNPKP